MVYSPDYSLFLGMASDLERRAAGISKERREAILTRSGAKAAEKARHASGGDTQAFIVGSQWGFARTTPSIAMFARAHHSAHHAPGPSQADSERRDPHYSPREPYVSVLGKDPDFHSPYSYAAMRDAYGVKDGWSVVEGGDLRTPNHEARSRAFVDEVKGAVRGSWAEESVRRGIDFAKRGDYVTAIKCYEQALELDPRHADAFVAKGAALANQGKFKDAAMDLEKALKINPRVHNAQKYLDGIEQKHPEALKGPPSIGYGAGRHVPPPSKVNGMNRPESLINGTVPVNPTQPEHRRAVSPPSDYNAALQRELAAAVEEKRRKKRRKEKSKKSSRDRG